MAKQNFKGRLATWLKKRYLLAATLALVILGGGALAYSSFNDDTPTTPPNPEPTPTQNENYVNLNPPTEQEKQDAEAHKQDVSNQTNPPPPPASTKKQVSPIITSASSSEVSAYVPGVFEDGGTCTAMATRGSQTVSGNSSAFANVSYTSCAPIKVSLSPGNWSITVSYSSAAAEGKSTRTFEVN